MKAVITGLNYLVAGLLGLVMAALPTLLVSWVILPSDGPPGEGFVIMLIYFVSSCACIPGYVALMALHREGRRDTRKLARLRNWPTAIHGCRRGLPLFYGHQASDSPGNEIAFLSTCGVCTCLGDQPKIMESKPADETDSPELTDT
jgi:hypothetical protein